MFVFVLDEHSGVSTYVQLAQQVRNALRLGLLQPGDQLPTAREVVAELAINPNTVLKAYRELEREGLVSPRPGAGTFVLKGLGSASPEDRDRLFRRLQEWVTQAHSAGLDDQDIDALFSAAREARAARGA